MYLPGFTQTAVAIAILLSVIVRSIRSGAAWGAVDEGAATAEHLRELTGLRTGQELLEAFGPPRMEDGLFPVSRAQVRRARSGLGVLIGDGRLDAACALVALASLLPVWPLWGTRAWLEVALMAAGAYQAAGWLAASTLLLRR